MKLTRTHIDRLELFLKKIRSDVYPEPTTGTHTEITEKAIRFLCDKYPLPTNSKILDVGCGQGVAMEIFSMMGFNPVGITLSVEDITKCVQNGHKVYEMDQSFLDFEDQEFDCVWCRHCLEHSIFPAFTLLELFRVLKTHGYLYVEVPCPDTSCKHQTNKNHYSVLGKSMWIELIKRTGFQILDILDINHTVPAGPDVYWAFIQQKP